MRLYFLLLLIFFQPTFSQHYVSGKTIDHILKTPIMGAIVYLNLEDSARGDTIRYKTELGKDTIRVWPAYITVDSAFTDPSGRFSIKTYKNKWYRLSAFYVIDSAYWPGDFKDRFQVNGEPVEEIVLKLPVFCEYAQYANQDSCPVCRLKDKCIEVIYGLGILNMDESGNVVEDQKLTYNAGCVFNPRCFARWYCQRCEKLF
jgi:hypothetical protein